MSDANEKRSSDISQATEQSPIGDNYSNLLWDQRLTAGQAKIVIACLFLIIGICQGYQSSLVFILQEEGASYADQSLFRLALLPFAFKSVFAPVIDLCYWRRFGKCKTWIAVSSMSIFVALVVCRSITDGQVQPRHVKKIACVWTVVNVVLACAQIAGEVLTIKLFETQEERGKGAGLKSIGQEVGFFIGLNIFVPLNDKEWLNSYLFSNYPLSRPLIQNSEFMLAIAIFSLILGIVTTCFVSEKQNERNQGVNPVKEYFKSIPKFFKCRSVLLLLLYLFTTRWFFFLIRDSLPLKMIDLGIKKTYLVNLQTLTFPLTLLAISLTTSMIKQGNIIRLSHIIKSFTCLLLIYMFIVYYDLKVNANIDRSKALLFVNSVLDKAFTGGMLCQAYINTAISTEHGSIFISLAVNSVNLSGLLPVSIGLKLIHTNFVDYDYFALFCCSAQILVLLVTYPLALSLDQKTTRDFDFMQTGGYEELEEEIYKDEVFSSAISNERHSLSKLNRHG